MVSWGGLDRNSLRLCSRERSLFTSPTTQCLVVVRKGQTWRRQLIVMYGYIHCHSVTWYSAPSCVYWKRIVRGHCRPWYVIKPRSKSDKLLESEYKKFLGESHMLPVFLNILSKHSLSRRIPIVIHLISNKKMDSSMTLQVTLSDIEISLFVRLEPTSY